MRGLREFTAACSASASAATIMLAGHQDGPV